MARRWSRPACTRCRRGRPRSSLEGWAYEPKWDGFRCLAGRDGDRTELGSRHGRELTRYFPEVVAALGALPVARLLLDGELVVAGPAGFDALLLRIHPAASRVRDPRVTAPATLIAFDLLHDDVDDLTAAPFAVRRARLEARLAAPPPGLALTPRAGDPLRAAEWMAALPGGAAAPTRRRAATAGRAPGRSCLAGRLHDGRRTRRPVARGGGPLASGDAVDRSGPRNRVGRVVVDWRQNDAWRSTIAPYSLAAAGRPVVAAPLTWDEVEAAAGRGDTPGSGSPRGGAAPA